jgi:hypothetical protein
LIRITIEKFRQQSTYSAPYRAIYWRYSHPIELFIDAVESNLKKKYYDFTNPQINGRLFESFKFKKQVSTRLHVGNSRIPLIGSLWEFGFFQSVCEEIQLFALDTGLGQRNSLGFGFMNPVIENLINNIFIASLWIMLDSIYRLGLAVDDENSISLLTQAYAESALGIIFESKEQD